MYMSTKLKYLFLILVLLSFQGCGEAEQQLVGESKGTPKPPGSAAVLSVEVPQWFEAVGTIRPYVEIAVEAQITARVREVLVRPGQVVKQGDALIRLDAGQSKSQVQQASSGVSAARAEYDRAKAAHERMSKLFAEKVVSKEEMEAAETAFLRARAELERLQDVRGEASIGLGYTVITAQADGEVAQRFVEPGDLAFPGKMLLKLQTGSALRLEALVREGLVGAAPIGANLPVVIDSLGQRVTARVDEVEPLADPVTRSFLVKATLPDLRGLYPGMYAKLLVPTGKRSALVVPEDAVVRVGQLETVLVKGEAGWISVHITTGQRLEQGVEVLSGLSEGDEVGLGDRS